jgi:hypothetical protein
MMEGSGSIPLTKGSVQIQEAKKQMDPTDPDPQQTVPLKNSLFYLAHPGAELVPPGEGEAKAHPVLLNEGLQPLPGPASLVQYHLACAGERNRVYNKIKLKSTSNMHSSFQCCESGSGSTWIRIHLAVLDPDPY